MARIPFFAPKGLGYDLGRDLLCPLPERLQWFLFPLFRQYCLLKLRRQAVEPDYSRERIEKYVEKARQRQTGYYGTTDTWLYSAIDDFPIRDKRGLIVGSLQPWYESIAIAYGCRSMTVLEYRDQKCDFPGIHFVNVNRMGEIRDHFDFAISVSSIEHDGLGRYGDPVSRDADMLSMASHRDLLTSDGVFFLSVPIGRDRIVGNMHRIYGRRRLPQLLWGFDIVATYGFDERQFDRDHELCDYQPLFVLRPWRRNTPSHPTSGKDAP